MSELQAIARAKVEAELNRRLTDLPSEVQALQRQLAAKGSLKSGNMLRGVLKLSQQALEAQSAIVATHYTWAAQEALAATQSWTQQLAADGANSLAPLVAKGSELIAEACRLADQPNLAARLVSDLETTHLQARSSIGTALEAVYATKSRGVLRKVTSMLGKILKPGA